MSVEWYDLGLRLRARDSGQPQPRLLHAPVAPADHPVAVRAHTTGSQVQISAAAWDDPAPRTATGADALRLLGDLGITLTAPTPATLVSDQPDVLTHLLALARGASPDSPAAAVAAHIGWWSEREDFPGGHAVVQTTDAARLRWVTGSAPAAERAPGTWQRALGIRDDSVRGLLDVHRLLTEGRALPWLDDLGEDAEWTYGAAQRQHTDGWDWRRTDSTSRAALGLRSRCDAADLYAAALLADPLHRARAVHTGHVVTGRAHPLGDRLRRCQVTCARLDARLRAGTQVLGWTGTPAQATRQTFTASVTDTDVQHGRLVLTLSGTTGAAPGDGEPVSLHAAGPHPARQRAGRRSYRSLLAARRSWLTTGRTPTPTRREVPLDVLVAGAGAD